MSQVVLHVTQCFRLCITALRVVLHSVVVVHHTVLRGVVGCAARQAVLCGVVGCVVCQGVLQAVAGCVA